MKYALMALALVAAVSMAADMVVLWVYFTQTF